MFVKKRHVIVFKILRPFFKFYFYFRYKLKVEKTKLEKNKPYLVLANHQTTLDPFIVSLSFKRPIYSMASADLFARRFIGKIISYLVFPIPKNKAKIDMNSIKITKKVIEEGGTVCIFPEGNRTYSGKTGYIDQSIAKLVKNLGVSLITYIISGGYGYDPRWSDVIRRGGAIGKVKRIISEEDIKKLSVDEIYAIIKSDLETDDFPTPYLYKHSHSAEHLERVLYICPKCQKVQTLYTKKDKIFCTSCGLIVTYQSNLELFSNDLSFKFKYIYEWYYYQIEEMKKKKYYPNIVIYKDTNINLFLTRINKKRLLLNSGDLILYSNRFMIEGKKSNNEFIFEDILSVTVLGKHKLNINVKNDTFQIKGDKKLNVLKYMQLYYYLKNDNGNDFLGM